MVNIYIVKKYVSAKSIEDCVKKEKDIKPSEIYLTEYSTQQQLESISPRK